jgi:hypothetical protein
MEKKQLVFRPTGEVRIPKDYELYLNGNVINKGYAESTAKLIYEKFEEVIDVPLWRAEEEGKYFTISTYQNIIEAHEDNLGEDDLRYKTANYFQSAEEAQKYADLMKFILTQRLLDNPEFCEVIEKLKGELA